MRVLPRMLLAGLSGDSGKTIVSLSLLSALRAKGIRPACFKKGPDYIDAAWLGWAAGAVCRNLDTYMVDSDIVRRRFFSSLDGFDMALIEGNRGLFDGLDVDGTHSSAALARLLQTPVLLVVDATKATRTLAALVKGCMVFDDGVSVAGVVLNRIAGSRHERVARDAIERHCGLPVLGALPKQKGAEALIPQRHLGLIPPTEAIENDRLRKRLTELGGQCLDIDGIINLTERVDPLDQSDEQAVRPVAEVSTDGPPSVKLAYFRDSVFTFYYPENLEALEAHGAELVPVSALADERLPEVDGLYIGGGFPETHLERLAGNRSLMASVREAGERNLPIFAECGGLIYLSKSLSTDQACHPMAGLFDLELSMHERPSGHGYAEIEVDADNPYFEAGVQLRGHEFHYSAPRVPVAPNATCFRVVRGVGLGQDRDGLSYKNTLASYIHIHADGAPDWARSFVESARQYRASQAPAGSISKTKGTKLRGPLRTLAIG